MVKFFQSNQITYAVFQSDWINFPQDLKKLIFFGLQCHKPLKMSALNLFYLTVESFLKVRVSSNQSIVTKNFYFFLDFKKCLVLFCSVVSTKRLKLTNSLEIVNMIAFSEIIACYLQLFEFS